MKKSLLFFPGLLFFCLFTGWSQSATRGVIKDEADKPVSSATVSLLQASDSLVVKFELTDNDGRYYFSAIKAGKYFIIVSSVGYDMASSSVFTLDKEVVEIPRITLLHSKKVLDNVTVTVSRPFIEMHLDKMVINVEASPSNAGTNVLEVLAKSPAVSVDLDENISLNGRRDVTILIDGKKTYLSGKDLSAQLKSMPAADIDQLEIMRNPPAKYEAEGTAGIINIKTKKSKQDGWNGSISLNGQAGIFSLDDETQTFFESQNNLNFNYKKSKINVFGSLGFSRYAGCDTAAYDKTYFTADYIVNGYSYFTFRGNYHGAYFPLSLGMDYYVDKRNTAGIAFTHTFGKGWQPRDRNTNLWDENHQLLGQYTSAIKPNFGFNNTTINLNWKHSIDTLGQEISFDADYVYYRNPNKDTLITNYYNNQAITGTSLISNNSNSSSNIFAMQTDYAKPFKGGRLEAGVKLSLVETVLNTVFYRYLNSEWVKNNDLENHSSYYENINAAYVNANKQIKKWSFQAGLRLENMNMQADQSLGNYKVSRTNTGLFPSFFTGYDLNKNNTFKLSVTRRINRYSFYTIMPYIQIQDSLDIWHGNPDLKPEHGTIMELGYAFKNKYFVNFSYTITHDAIRYVAAQVGEQKITEFYPININRLDNLSLNIAVPIKITGWWETNLFTNVYSNKFYDLQNNTVSKFYFTLNENWTNTFKMSKSLKGELTVNYTTRSIDQLGETLPKFNSLSVALQKQILEEKGSLTLSINDPFQWCYKSRFNGTFLRMHEKDINYFSTRYIGITFNYRFGKVNNERRQHVVASQEEQNR
jgi:hypothetical protein